MLWIGDKKVSRLTVGGKAVAAMWRGAVKIYEAISSCFGSGVWRSNRVWKGSDKWK
jgi:hypothetical protein